MFRLKMTEFYVELSKKQIDDLIAKKLEMYRGELNVGGWPSIQQPHDSFVYTYYAQHVEKEVGTFELYLYMGMYEGVEMYSFYVEQPVTEDSKRRLEERRIENIKARFQGRIKRQYENMKIKEINQTLKHKKLGLQGKKEQKLQRLVSHDLSEIVENESKRRSAPKY